MILNRDTAYLSEAVVDLQIAAVGRKESQTDWRRIVDQLQGRLLGKGHAEDRCRFHRGCALFLTVQQRASLRVYRGRRME